VIDSDSHVKWLRVWWSIGNRCWAYLTERKVGFDHVDSVRWVGVQGRTRTNDDEEFINGPYAWVEFEDVHVIVSMHYGKKTMVVTCSNQ
jgi:hypothetical protein